MNFSKKSLPRVTVFFEKHKKCIKWTAIIIAVLIILRNVLVDALWEINELSWVQAVDQKALGIAFLIICLLCSITCWFKLNTTKAVISDAYIGVALIIFVAYLYLRQEGTIGFEKLLWRINFSDIVFLPIAEVFILSVANQRKNSLSYVVTRGPVFPDNPINDEKEDKLGFDEIINVLLDDIQHTDLSKSSFSIGIVGKWGQGKSSFANLLKGRLDPQKIILIEFNPRNSKDTVSIAEDFFNNFSESLHPYHTGIESSIRKYANALQIVLDNNIVGKCIGFIQKFSATDSKEYINKAIKEIGRTIYIVVDDLDRLTAKEILETLKLIDRNADFVNTVFITAYDKHYVNAVLKHYLGYESDNFTDKYFNYEVSLPVPNGDNIYRIVHECLDKISDKLIHNELFSFWEKRGHNYTHYFINIRHIKRFMNIFLSRYKRIHEDVNVEDFFNLTLLRYYDIETYNSLVGMDLFITNSPPFNGENPKVIHLKGDYKKHLYGDHWEYTSEVLERMFPKSDVEASISTYQRIHDMDYFDLYFYDYKEGKLYLKDLNALLEVNNDEDAKKVFEDYYKEDNIGLTRFLENVAPQKIMTKEMLVRYLTLALQYRTHCQPSASTLMGQIELPLLHEGYNDYKFLFGKDDIDLYRNEIDSIYTALIPKYPYELQSILENFNEEENDSLFVIDRNNIREKELKCQDLFLENFDEDKNDLIQAFYVSMIAETGIKKCIQNASRRLLAFMNDHKTFVASNIFDFTVNSHPETHEQHLFIFIDQIYKGFTWWFPIDNTDFIDWVETINDNSLKNIISRIYKQPDNTLAVKALKSHYEKEDFEDVWKAIKMSDDSVDFTIISKAIKKETVYDLTTLSNETKLSKERIIQLSKEYDNNVQLQPQYLRDIHPYEVGDIVKLKSKKQKELEANQKNIGHIFKIQSFIGNDKCKLQFVNELVEESDLLPVLIESNEDKNIYYDPIVAATVLAPGQAPPIRHTNYSYYMDSLKKSFIGGNSEYDLIKQENLAYVHEVQHWLRDGRTDDGLKIRYR